MNAAAITFVVLCVLNSGVKILRHGQAIVQSGPIAVLDLGLAMFLLYQAGLFK
jgi:hypothetical protein